MKLGEEDENENMQSFAYLSSIIFSTSNKIIVDPVDYVDYSETSCTVNGLKRLLLQNVGFTLFNREKREKVNITLHCRQTRAGGVEYIPL